ncbi:PspC domain-containing protein [candidate division KSB1 bacterium]|nr:PspC domain-containing protein [candidate division KSB1 bacterium]
MEEQTTADYQPKKLYRSKINRMVGGVCGGLAEYLAIDPIVIRIGWVLSLVFDGLGGLLYIACLILIPENSAQSYTAADSKPPRADNTMFWGVLLIIIGGIFLIRELDWWHFHWPVLWPFFFRWRLLLPILIILAGVFYITYILRGEGEGTAPFAGGTRPDRQPITRIPAQKMIAGVCAGFGQYLKIDVIFVRIGWILITLLSFWFGVIAYLVLTVVLPEAAVVSGTRTTSGQSYPPQP